MLLSFFRPQPMHVGFGEQEITESMYAAQVRIAFLFVLPMSIFFGQLSLRLASHPFSIIQADLWNTSLRILLADLVIEFLQNSMTCVPFEQEDDIQELIMQSFGYSCPLYARALSPWAAAVVYGMRLAALAVGIYIGEGWMPVGLTGGIATGKSTVASLLMDEEIVQTEKTTDSNEKDNEKENEDADEKGNEKENEDADESSYVDGTVFLVDTDKIGHDILLKSTAGNVHSQLVAEFGSDILNEDGVIERRKLGAIIFGDKTARRKLNSITHPKIIRQMLRKLMWGVYISGKDLTVAEIPLLFEAGFLMRGLFCLTICVTCSSDQELERLMARNPDLSKEECEARIASQMPIAKKASMADIVIENTGDLKSLESQVEVARLEVMKRVYGVGLTLFQLVAIIGVSLPAAIYFKHIRAQA